VIQLERKGFFRCDVAYGGPNKPVVLFAIPDGKQIKAAQGAKGAPGAVAGGKKK
jgi:glutamyl-tRNA synthetase